MNPRMICAQFTSRPRADGGTGWKGLRLRPDISTVQFRGNVDTRLRKLVAFALTPKRVAAMQPRIQQIVDGLIDAMLAKGEIELLWDFAYQLPTLVMCDMPAFNEKVGKRAVRASSTCENAAAMRCSAARTSSRRSSSSPRQVPVSRSPASAMRAGRCCL